MTPDLSIFEGYPDIHKYITKGAFTDPELKRASIENNKHNFFCYSVMKAAPLCVEATLYDQGNYNQGDRGANTGYGGQTATGLYTAYGMNKSFMEPYNVLCNLPEITKYADGGAGTLLVLSLIHIFQRRESGRRGPDACRQYR